MKVQIRQARQGDFDEWLGMREDLYSGLTRAFHKTEMSMILDAQDKACFIAVRDDEQVIGFAELSLRNVVDGCLTSPVGFLEGLFVKSTFRGHGCGGQLVEFAAEWFTYRGCSEMATDAEADNSEAQKFHESMGFTETYRIVEYRKALE